METKTKNILYKGLALLIIFTFSNNASANLDNYTNIKNDMNNCSRTYGKMKQKYIIEGYDYRDSILKCVIALNIVKESNYLLGHTSYGENNPYGITWKGTVWNFATVDEAKRAFAYFYFLDYRLLTSCELAEDFANKTNRKIDMGTCVNSASIYLDFLNNEAEFDYLLFSNE